MRQPARASFALQFSRQDASVDADDDAARLVSISRMRIRNHDDARDVRSECCRVEVEEDDASVGRSEEEGDDKSPGTRRHSARD